MSNRSSCRILRTLGMDGFLGFKCGPSCSEKKHNKEIKALIDAIDELLAYDSKTKKELGAAVPGFGDARWHGVWEVFTGKLGDIKDKALRLQGKHRRVSFLGSSYQPLPVHACDKALQGIRYTADSAKSRIYSSVGDVVDPRLLGEERFALTSNRDELERSHVFWVN